MQSHRGDFQTADLLRNVGWSLIPVAAFVLALHVGARGSFWPPPRPALDTERTVLFHQADACRSTNQAEVLLLGDSSCLMNVSARLLEERLRRPVLNLGTFSFLDLQAQSLFLREFNRHQANPPRVVVLLQHPEALRRLGSDNYYVATLTNYWAGRDYCEPESLAGRLSCWLGLEIFNGRLRSRLPMPLPGAYGRRYGFNKDLEQFMSREKGSAVDPEQISLSGNPEFRLAATLERASRAFRAAVPAGTKLIAGITPVPARFAGPRYVTRQAELLRAWGQMLQADLILTNLPPALPDHAFARTTHLREDEIPAYTESLAAALEPTLR